VKQLFISSHDLFWKLWNKISFTLKPRDLERRQDTYPYLSSDGYAFACSLRISKKASMDDLLEIVNNLKSDSTLYLPGRFVSHMSNILRTKKKNLRTLVIGDDDIAQDEASLKILVGCTKKIYSVNLKSNFGNAQSIPLGLESPSYRTGGRLSDFKKIPTCVPSKRPHNFLVAWNSKTNSESRTKAFNQFSEVENSLLFGNRIAAQTLHKLTRRTLFIPSPRGNGLDTHRIWESLYLGAIPIVVSDDFLDSYLGWPIWVVGDWAEVTNLTRSELEKKYSDLIVPYSDLIANSKAVFRKFTT
jgi:hypothetical protein